MLKYICHPTFSPLPLEASPLFSKSPTQAFPTSHLPDDGWIKPSQSICLKEESVLPVFINRATSTKVFHPACPISPHPLLLGHRAPMQPCVGHTIPGTSAPPPEEVPSNLSWVTVCFYATLTYPTLILPGCNLSWGCQTALVQRNQIPKSTPPGKSFPSSALGRCRGMTFPAGTGDKDRDPPQPQQAPTPPHYAKKQSISAFWRAKGLMTNFRWELTWVLVLNFNWARAGGRHLLRCAQRHSEPAFSNYNFEFGVVFFSSAHILVEAKSPFPLPSSWSLQVWAHL